MSHSHETISLAGRALAEALGKPRQVQHPRRCGTRGCDVIKAPTSGDGKKPGGHRLSQAEGHQSESEKERGCFQQSDVITMSYHTVPGKTKQTSETNHEQRTQRSFREKKKSKNHKRKQQNKNHGTGNIKLYHFQFRHNNSLALPRQPEVVQNIRLVFDGARQGGWS